jgi:hypothetical protein
MTRVHGQFWREITDLFSDQDLCQDELFGVLLLLLQQFLRNVPVQVVRLSSSVNVSVSLRLHLIIQGKEPY